MGYTTGRRLTKEFIFSQAAKYKSKSEFQKNDSSCYVVARTKGFLEECCSHMKPCNFSIPQKICKEIIDHLLNEKSLYNTRQIIKPFELDIYYKKHNLAFEYHGKKWHSTQECIERDNKKEKLCKNKNICLIVILENNRRYEEDIKAQIIKNLNLINKQTSKTITSKEVTNFVVNYKNVFKDVKYDLDEIRQIIDNCTTIKEFSSKYHHYYKYLSKIGCLHLLDHLRRVRKPWTLKEIKDECLKITDYRFLVRNGGLYNICYKKNLLKTLTSHMKKKRTITIESIINLSKNYRRRGDFKKDHPSEYRKALKLGLIEKLFPISYKGFKSKWLFA